MSKTNKLEIPISPINPAKIGPPADAKQPLELGTKQEIDQALLIQPDPDKYPIPCATPAEISKWIASREANNASTSSPATNADKTGNPPNAANISEKIQLSDPDGLVILCTDKDALDTKIAGSLETARSKINQARADGKHVLYLPGSYDLLHKGHLLYIYQAIDFYLENARVYGVSLNRENLFVVGMADDDKLVRAVKAYKFNPVPNGENFKRPLVNELAEELKDPEEIDPFKNQDNRHARLKGLAALPIDLGGFLPNPATDTKDLPDPASLDTENLKLQLDSIPNLNPSVAAVIAVALSNYPVLQRALQQAKTTGQPLQIKPEALAEIGLEWSIELWQLYLNSYLFSSSPGKIPQNKTADSRPAGPFTPGSVSRIISKGDANYLDTIRILMNFSGVNCLIIDDLNYGSTTNLLKRFIKAHCPNAAAEIRKWWAREMRRARASY